METKLERIAEISANSPRPEFTSLYHLINKEMLLQCHKELDGNKAVGVDEITKCILRSPAVANAFWNGRFAEHNGRPLLVD